MASLAVTDDGVLNLAVGHPAPSLRPRELLAAACSAAAAELVADESGEGFCLSYAPCAGDGATRRELARFLTEATRSEVRADRLFMTTGVSHGIEAACGALTVPGDVVVLVRPSYFLAANIFRDWQLQCVEIEGSPCGLDVDALEAALVAGLRPRLLYLVPTHANPSGATIPAAHRARLVALACRFEFFILADEVYHLLSWATPDVPLPMRAFDGARACSAAGSSSISSLPPNTHLPESSLSSALTDGIWVSCVCHAPGSQMRTVQGQRVILTAKTSRWWQGPPAHLACAHSLGALSCPCPARPKS